MNHAELRAAAEAMAFDNPGPWDAVLAPDWGSYLLDAEGVAIFDTAADSETVAYIALTNPATVLALLDEIEGLRAALRGVAPTLPGATFRFIDATHEQVIGGRE